LLYEWRKDISQQMWDSRNYQMTSHFVSTVIMAATLQTTAIAQFQLKILSLLRS